VGKALNSKKLFLDLKIGGIGHAIGCHLFEGRCIEEGVGASFIDVVTDDDRVHGFTYSQLIQQKDCRVRA